MTGHISRDGGGDSYALENLPIAARQAIYHYVTGKTENLSQKLRGNVLITSDDIDNLYGMLCDQLGTHTVEYGPTTSVDIKLANERTFTHSSWQHYKAVKPLSTDLTSEIIIKMEFVLNIQNTPGPQRCIVNVAIDSSLPLISKDFGPSNPPYSFWYFISQDWETVSVSIDFVDFMVARGFLNVIEEWFKTLKCTPASKNNSKLLGKYDFFRNVSTQGGRLGMATFIAAFAFFQKGEITFEKAFYATSFGFFLWSLYLSMGPMATKAIFRRITSSIIPSIILYTPSDIDKYEELKNNIASSKFTIISMMAFTLSNILINIFSNYIWSLF